MILKIVSTLTLISLPFSVEAIVGGKDVMDPHKYPWMVEVTAVFEIPKNGRYRSSCGGSIISKTTVMTAAHCVREENGNVATFARISLGHSNLNSDEIVNIHAWVIKIHPQAFNETTRQWENDIALLQLSKELQFKTSIQPIDLPNQNYTDATLLDTSKTKLIVAGWGHAFQISEEEVKPYKDRGFNSTQNTQEFNSWFYQKLMKKAKTTDKLDLLELYYMSNWREKIQQFLKKAKTTNNLRFLELYYRNPDECIRLYKLGVSLFDEIENTNELKRGLICASGKIPEIQSTCSGDSGGPLMRQDMVTGDIQVIGIVSTGWCSSVLPNSFTKVSKHVPWIHENSNLSRSDHYWINGSMVYRKHTNPWLKSRTSGTLLA